MKRRTLKGTPQLRIVITGFMGAGKTLVAHALARQLGIPAIDLDSRIAEAEGRAIAAIIDTDGEARFREIETRELSLALNSNDQFVIALGGGAWTIEENRLLAEASGVISVWLDAPFDLCWQRIQSSGDIRPLGRDEHQSRALYESRRAAYSTAGFRFSIGSNQPPETICQQIKSRIFPG